MIGAYIIACLFLVGINSITPVISAKSMTAITNVDLKSMLYLGAIAMVLYVLSNMIRYVSDRCSTVIQNKTEIKIKEDVSKELFDLEMKNFDKEGTNFFANRIESEPRTLAGVFSNIQYFMTSILTSIGIFVYIFVTSPIIGLFLILSSLINFFIQRRRLKFWEEERKKSNEMYEKYSSNFAELIHGIKDIKVLNLKNYLIKKTKREQKEIILYEDSISKKNAKTNLAMNCVTLFMDFLFIVLGVILIKYGNLTGAAFLVIYMYQGRATYMMSDINQVYRHYKEFNLSLERLYEVIDGIKYPKEEFGTKSIKKVEGSIEFKDVSFGYDDNEVLKKISFHIDQNKTIGIVGKSGAGKSTILNLINKLYSPQEGNILLDGVDIKELSEKTIRENITTITQNPYIFNMSIKENLKVVKPDATDEEIAEKCRQCALDEYIESLENKYDTLVGENGVILSGGLKQRLAIARAILKNSKIIMLDEATSSLDNETQDFIHHSIKKIQLKRVNFLRKDYLI